MNLTYRSTPDGDVPAITIADGVLTATLINGDGLHHTVNIPAALYLHLTAAEREVLDEYVPADWLTPPPAPVDYAAMRGRIAADIAAERWRREVSGTTVQIASETVPVLTEREAIGVLTAAIVAGETLNTWPTGWKFADEQFRVITADDLRAVGLACHAHVQDVFSWEAAELARLTATPDTNLADFVIDS